MKIAMVTIHDVQSVDELYQLLSQHYDKDVSVSTTHYAEKPATVAIEADVAMVFSSKEKEVMVDDEIF